MLRPFGSHSPQHPYGIFVHSEIAQFDPRALLVQLCHKPNFGFGAIVRVRTAEHLEPHAWQRTKHPQPVHSSRQ